MRCNRKNLFLYSLVFLSYIGCAFTHQPEKFLESIKGQQDEGQQIVQHFCATCHAPNPQLELGAPTIGSETDWKARFAKGIDGLLKNLEEGKGAMPPRGGCFECSDQQLYLAIIALLPDSLIKTR